MDLLLPPVTLVVLVELVLPEPDKMVDNLKWIYFLVLRTFYEVT